ncbi:PhoH family protein [Oceanibacterium hippocampi]|nr:PhoH family protein [Oceanibacterium hippocampi]
MTFANNQLLAALVGVNDRHLARFEQRLGIELSARGNSVVLQGAEAECAVAKLALDDLYARLEKGQAVGDGDVDGAIRLAEAVVHRKESDALGAAQRHEIRTKKRTIMPRNANQSRYVEALRGQTLVFGLGPAGTGKTYLTVAVAVQMLITGQVDRIVLSRPAVEAGERLGFLPGDLREKVDPYLRPIYDALFDMLPADEVHKRLENGEIEVAPLAFMRGRTLANSFVLLDEAQNTTPMQMKMLLTRIGENSRMAVTGDPSQVDLPPGTRSGLVDALEVLAGVEGIVTIRFSHDDVVRHAMVTRIVRAYDARDDRKAAGKTGDAS